MKMFKPDGQAMEVNKNSVKHALLIGWTKKKPVKKAAKKAK